MNRAQIRSSVRQLLNEDIPGFWTDAELNNYINLANTRVNSIISTLREDYFTGSATFNTVIGQMQYELPPDCRFIRRMEIFDPTNNGYIVKLSETRFPKTEAQGDWLFPAAGQPKRYIIIGTTFKLLPEPDSVISIRIYYDIRQDDLGTDSDTPESPSEYHDLVMFWATLLAKKQNENDDTGLLALFNMRKQEMIQSLISRGGEDTHAVTAYLEGII